MTGTDPDVFGRRAHWPASLLLVRHGESQGNVARDEAEAAGLPVIDIAERDMDVPLSARGEDQARALGEWLGELGRDRPTVALASPYVRAQQTGSLALEAAGLDLELVVDERLREREFGALDRLTRRGIMEQFPKEAEARRRLGKFYHRPPGGESWCDVALRVRSAVDSISRAHRGERVVVVAHQVVILMFRYVLEHLTESEILDIDRAPEVANCAVTTFVRDGGRTDARGMRLVRFNETVPVRSHGATVTSAPDVAGAPR